MFPFLLIGGAVALLLFFSRSTGTGVRMTPAKEEPSIFDSLLDKGGMILKTGATTALAAGGKALMSFLAPVSVAPVAAAPVAVIGSEAAAVGLSAAPAVALPVYGEIGAAAALEATGMGGLYEVGVVAGAEAGAVAAPAAYGALATTGIVAAFAAPVILAMIFGARAGAKKAEAAMGASSAALQNWPATLESIAPALDAALAAKNYNAYMEALPWGEITAAASYGGGSTKGVDFTAFQQANKAAFWPVLQGAMTLVPAELLKLFDAMSAAPYWAYNAPPVRIFPSLTEYPGVILLKLQHERLWPGTLNQQVQEAITAAAYVPDSK